MARASSGRALRTTVRTPRCVRRRRGAGWQRVQRWVPRWPTTMRRMVWPQPRHGFALAAVHAEPLLVRAGLSVGRPVGGVEAGPLRARSPGAGASGSRGGVAAACSRGTRSLRALGMEARAVQRLVDVDVAEARDDRTDRGGAASRRAAVERSAAASHAPVNASPRGSMPSVREERRGVGRERHATELARVVEAQRRRRRRAPARRACAGRPRPAARPARGVPSCAGARPARPRRGRRGSSPARRASRGGRRGRCVRPRTGRPKAWRVAPPSVRSHSDADARDAATAHVGRDLARDGLDLGQLRHGSPRMPRRGPRREPPAASLPMTGGHADGAQLDPERPRDRAAAP